MAAEWIFISPTDKRTNMSSHRAISIRRTECKTSHSSLKMVAMGCLTFRRSGDGLNRVTFILSDSFTNDTANNLANSIAINLSSS